MANIKISQLTAKAANLATTDLFEVSVVSGLSYVSKKITGQEIIDGVISYIGTPTLQTVTDEGNITTNSIVVGDTSSYYSQISNISLRAEDNAANTYAYIGVSGLLGLGNGTFESQLQNTNVTNTGVVLQFPNKTSGSYTIATTSDIPSLSGYVPYTGATTNVDLGEYEIKVGQLTLDTSPTGTAAVGTTRWNNTLGSTETTLKGGSVILKNGVDLVARVVNKVTPNTTLTKAAYQVVKVSGAQGGRLAIDLAQANNDNNSADTLGVVTETIATNQEGFIITVGQLENINTTGSLQGETWADGDVLYLSPTTPGAITNVKPTGATGHIVVIGYVEYSHAINGKIYVKIMNGWELDELHNVYINTGTLANNQVLTYNSSSQLWENKTNSSTLTVNTTSIASGTVGRVLFEGTGNVLQESANLFWDNTNSRLNIGAVASNTATLDIKSPGGLTSDIAFRVRNHNDNNNLGYINGVGDVVFGSGSSVTTGSGGNGTVVSIGENAAVNSGFSGYPIAIGRNSVSNGNSISIGNGASNGTGQTINANIAIGKDAINTNSTTNCISIGNTVSTGQVSGTLAIGGSINFGGYLGGGNIAVGYNYTGGNFVNDAYAFGKASSATTLDIGSSFSIYINRTTRSFFVNQNSNLVFRTNNTLTSGTHFDANATNTITLHNGTIPATTIANAGQLYVEGGALRYRADEGTITNVGGSVQSVASAATVTPVHTNKFVKITAQAAALTLANPTGTWAEGQELIIRIKDDGTARAITWDTNYRAIGVALPTTTVISKTTYVGVIYNFTDTKWDVIGVTTEA